MPCVGSRTDPMAEATKTEANQVLDSPLIVSAGRVEPITSKATVSDEVLVLAKSIPKSGSQQLEDLTLKSHQERVVLQEHTHSLSQEHSS